MMSSVHAMSTGWSHIACSSWNFRKKWQGTWSPFEWKAWSSVTKAHSCWAKAEKLLNVLLFLYFGRKPRLNGRSNRSAGFVATVSVHRLWYQNCAIGSPNLCRCVTKNLEILYIVSPRCFCCVTNTFFWEVGGSNPRRDSLLSSLIFNNCWAWIVHISAYNVDIGTG